MQIGNLRHSRLGGPRYAEVAQVSQPAVSPTSLSATTAARTAQIDPAFPLRAPCTAVPFYLNHRGAETQGKRRKRGRLGVPGLPGISTFCRRRFLNPILTAIVDAMADGEVGGTAGLETCATSKISRVRRMTAKPFPAASGNSPPPNHLMPCPAQTPRPGRSEIRFAPCFAKSV